MSIVNLLNQVKEEEIVLPAIQRDFVWGQDRVIMLLDSVMRGYPIGIVLLWETYNDVQFRHFDRDYLPDGRHAFSENRKRRNSGWCSTASSASNLCLWPSMVRTRGRPSTSTCLAAETRTTRSN